MKFFHISDLHIGLKLFNHDLIEEQKYILNLIIEKAMEEKPDAILIAGDIYDRSIPSSEAIEVFDDFIIRMRSLLPQTKIMAISGNHDSATRLNQYRKILAEKDIYMVGLPPGEREDFIEKVIVTDDFGEVHFYLLPFVNPSMCRRVLGLEDGERLSYEEAVSQLIQRENINEDVRNVLMSHQFYLPSGCESEKVERMDSEIRTVGNIDAVKGDILLKFDYAALGHIHKPMRVGDEFHRYSGTPMPYSVSEAGQEKGIVLVEMFEKGRIQTKVLKLTPMREIKKIKGSYQEVQNLACDDYVSLILTDKKEFEVIEMRESLRRCFPNLLEIKRENLSLPDYASLTKELEAEKNLSPMELCAVFASDLTEEEEKILGRIMNEINMGEGRG